MIELFAWLTELLLYRVNQVPDKSYEAFLGLLEGTAEWELSGKTLTAATQDTLLKLRQRHRAVTIADYESLVMNNWPNQVARVRAFANRNLELNSESDSLPIEAEGHVSVVVIPSAVEGVLSPPLLSQELKNALMQYLDERRLLTTKLHVVDLVRKPVKISAKLHLEPGKQADKIKEKAEAQLTQFFHPLLGGDLGQGWPFGRSIYVSEVYQQLDQVSGIDYVTAVTLNDGTQSIELREHELVGTLTFDVSVDEEEA